MLRPALATVLMLMLLLLASIGGTAIGQSEEDRTGEPPLFAIVMNPAQDGSGIYSAFERIEAGTVSRIEADGRDGTAGSLLRLDPHPPGGDTFDVQTSAGTADTATPGTMRMAGWSWEILSGSGVFEDLVGGGDLVTAIDPGVEPGTGFYFGATERAIGASDVASRNWATILTRFPDSGALAKRADKAVKSKRGRLQQIRKQNRADIKFLQDIGSHPCYASAFESLLFKLEQIDSGIASKLKNDPTADFELQFVGELAEEYDLAVSLSVC